LARYVQSEVTRMWQKRRGCERKIMEVGRVMKFEMMKKS
jgi:hypothetical protein